MNKKQFIALIFTILVIPVVSLIDVSRTRAARNRCGDYAMSTAGQSFPDAFLETGDQFPPKKLKPEMAQNFKTTYDFFYDFCMAHFEHGR